MIFIGKRLLIAAIAAPALLWVAWSLSHTARIGEAEEVAQAIVAGDTFAREVVEHAVARIDARKAQSDCDERGLMVLLVLTGDLIAQNAITSSADVERQDQLTRESEATARSLAACSPHRSLAWLSLYSARIGKNGFDASAKKLLAMSYLTAPREGWIALRRSQLSVRVFDFLSEDLQARSVDEIIGLAEIGLEDYSAQLYANAGPHLRARLTSRMQGISPSRRAGFVQALDRLEVPVPSALEPQDALPWHARSAL